MCVGRLAGVELQGAHIGSGAAFLLRGAPLKSDSIELDGWVTSVVRGKQFVVVRSGREFCLDDVLPEAVHFANAGLDLLCLKSGGGCDVVIRDPDTDSLIWAAQGADVVMRATVVIPLSSPVLSTETVPLDINGNEIPQPIPPDPRLHNTFRFIRAARTAESLFEAYRNAFLALECLLDHLAPQKSGEREGVWFKRALGVANKKRSVSDLAPPGEQDPINWVYKNIYGDLRSGLMHAKQERGYHMPGDRARHMDIEGSLTNLWLYVKKLMTDELGTPVWGDELSDTSWRVVCEESLRTMRPSMTSDNSTKTKNDHPFALPGNSIVEISSGSVSHQGDSLSSIDGKCSGDEARSLGVINRIGAMGAAGEARVLSELPSGLEVGGSVSEFQVRIGIRRSSFGGIRSYFSM
ncbi:hypothetical protein [Segniliparus rugosus]|uniref:Uncharacterized protein n=1 Tax=Segniliparus rugosus (strain ATCC BAA-974 / DSM 45345 / CCUG 50838 / CIP 108380 / JCM 13579 / CDC 945) TaxID=679197 RepID=U1N4P9_SEGRC|nr:hypothetical protein [Segniliparus rugosus]ERG69174.1 hypothetical protein HMPREF9336_04318 [Segniliparus rugosus ATCC BAA-974]